MITLQSSSCYLISPSKFKYSSLSSSSSSSVSSSISSACGVQWRFNSLQTNHGFKLSPLFSTVAEGIVETSVEESEYVEIGYISDVHGLQGEIRIKHNTDFPELRLGKPGKRWLRQQYYGKENVIEVELESGRGRPGDKSWIVKFSGFDDVDQARQLVGSTFLVKNSDRPELEEGEYYSRDLVGVRVFHKETGEAVGTVVNVFNNGGNDLLHVMLETSATSSHEDKKQEEMAETGPLVWIPFVEAIVPVVDLEKREMQILPPKGLLELNLRTNDKSKKERRLLDWRERKKFQRRLISAKKKLGDLEQHHIFHGLTYGEKSQRSSLAEQIVSLNSNLLQSALRTLETPINGCNIKEIKHNFTTSENGKSLKISKSCLTSASEEKLDAYSVHREVGTKLISEGKVATILVMNRIEQANDHEADDVDFENSDNGAISLLESLLVDMNNSVEAEARKSMPVILISPAEDIQLLEQVFASHDHFNFNSEKVRFLAEEKLPVVSCSAVEQKKNKVLMKSPWEILQIPIGSAGIVTALSSNNILVELLKSGVEYIEVCTLNERCPFGNPVFLGFVHSCETDIGVITSGDKMDFEDNFHVVLPMKSVQKLAMHVEKHSWHPELKSNSHVELVDKKWIDVIPSAPNSYEFHFSFGSLLDASSINNTCLVEVTD